ncbi:unnamed protein product [Prunus armeniaca]|uniref:Uncharacterized protein n=1 Tax=Prunus armeniaca TaxID=36596 RepID=A0A6J5V306_PRUAR|nr:unnamed protein product [Prunus armeniaca]
MMIALAPREIIGQMAVLSPDALSLSLFSGHAGRQPLRSPDTGDPVLSLIVPFPPIRSRHVSRTLSLCVDAATFLTRMSMPTYTRVQPYCTQQVSFHHLFGSSPKEPVQLKDDYTPEGRGGKFQIALRSINLYVRKEEHKYILLKG